MYSIKYPVKTESFSLTLLFSARTQERSIWIYIKAGG